LRREIWPSSKKNKKIRGGVNRASREGGRYTCITISRRREQKNIITRRHYEGVKKKTPKKFKPEINWEWHELITHASGKEMPEKGDTKILHKKRGGQVGSEGNKRQGGTNLSEEKRERLLTQEFTTALKNTRSGENGGRVRDVVKKKNEAEGGS